MTQPSNTITVTTPSDLEIRMTRSFNAPRALVFEAMSKREHMERWWGPRKYETIIDKLDFRPGGAWRFINRDRDTGEEFAFRGEFREIVPNEKISWTFEWEGLPGHISVDTMTLEEVDGRTTVTANSVFDSKEDRDGMLQSGMEEGANESYDRLEELLATLKARV
jgi:uncharacterized protein YndB with AHSA1/START domain